MTVELMNAAWDAPVLAGPKLVLLYLSSVANEKGECWPPVGVIAKYCGMSERTVQGHLRDLEIHGHIVRRPRDGYATLYMVRVAEK